ncbi:hypothetical protein [Xenorhabdus kozodoii]|uniref:Uncharacterized protein n=1 Tax=Xenorhabdus kozodoii TaxID=351676 RepID=A0A2D0L9R9_9GAMM|nr:hypothetical protein [Xenorhabdus kozodoii]PHM72416.1 hypothetical protein Xkoz_02363 [Xenorhabdus kozodoii]
MKVLFNIILIALSLIIQPVLAAKDYTITFEKQIEPFELLIPFYLLKVNNQCMPKFGPYNFTLDSLSSKFSIDAQDVNSGACVGRQKKIVWLVSRTLLPPTGLDPQSCLVQFSVTFYWIAGWQAAVTSTCDDLVKQATCEGENCYNYCADLDDCYMPTKVNFGNEEKDLIKIVFK